MPSRSSLILAGVLALVAWTGLARAHPFLPANPVQGPTPSQEAAQIPLGRLPDTVRPMAYRLDLTIDPAQPQFSGHTEIDAVLLKPARVIFMDGRDLRVSRAQVRAGGSTVDAHYQQVDDTGVVRLDLPRELPAGPVTLSFDYTAGLRDDAEGLFHARVGGDWYAWTQLESIDARRMFPSFDEPGFKTPFTVSVTAPASAKVFANAPELSVTLSAAGLVHRFAPTRPLPTYLVALCVGPFDVLQTTVPPNEVRTRPLPFRVIATRGQKPRMQLALTEGPRLLERLERFIGMPYPYAKLDLAASPLEDGGMENAGLILFEDPILLLSSQARLDQLNDFGDTVAHEMSHQWFGDLVTPDWWADIWLNESFAEWLGDKISDEWRPDLEIGATALAESFSAMATDAQARAHPIHRQITRSRQIAAAFDDITYLKGAQVLRMFESYLGSEKLRQALRLHLERFAWGTASTDDFFRSLATATGDPRLVKAMRSFIDQSGVPVVTVHETPRGLLVSQQRYHPLGVDAPAPELWGIPVCLSRSRTRTCTLLDTASMTIPPVPGTGPLMPDAGGVGYYRFRLDDAAWSPLIQAIPTLSTREAMAVGDSLWADFAAGTGRFSRVVAGARALGDRPELPAATLLAEPLERLARSVLTPEEQPGYRRLMDAIYAPRLAALGLDVHRGAYASEPAPTRALRQALVPLVALEARDARVRMTLAEAAVASLGGQAAALDDAFRLTALRVAVQDRGVSFMQQLKAALAKSSDPGFREDATQALGSADTPELATAALDLAYSPGMPSFDTVRILARLTGQPGARSTVLDFVDDHFDQVIKRLPGYARGQLISWLFERDCSEGDLARADAWAHARLKDLGGADLALERTKERIGQCAALRQAQGGQIAAVLGPTGSTPRAGS